MEKVVTVLSERQEKQKGEWTTKETYPTNKITLNNFIKSFVIEKSRNEKRYDKRYTKHGYFHTKAIVYFDEATRLDYTFKFKE